MKYAAEHAYTHIWVMDDDCIPTETSLQAFIDVDEKLKGQYGWLSSKVLWKDCQICQMNVQRKRIWQNVKDFNSTLIPVVMASFVSLFVPTNIVLEMGLPIKEFFIWTDDWEFTRRISRKYPCFLCNQSVVIHKSNLNIGANIATDTIERLDRYKYLYRNDVYLYRREGIEGVSYEILRLMWHVLRIVVLAKSCKAKRISIIISGTKAGIHFYPRIEYVKNTSCAKKEKK